MKKSKTVAPSDAPAGTQRLGGEIGWFAGSLTVDGDSLDPADVTKLLQRSPTKSWRRGDAVPTSSGTQSFTKRFGRWAFEISPVDTDEWDIGEVIELLFAGLPSDAETWRRLAELGHARISIGLNLPNSSSREFDMKPDLMRFLADRQVRVWFDIYAEDET